MADSSTEPTDLLALTKVVKAKCERIAVRHREIVERDGREPDYSDMELAIETGEFPAGPRFPGQFKALFVLNALTGGSGIESVWKSLFSRVDEFSACADPIAYQYLDKRPAEGDVSQSTDLFCACMELIAEWMHTPKRTPIANRRLLLGVAVRAKKLRESLLKITGFERYELWSVFQLLNRGELEQIASYANSEILLNDDELEKAVEGLEGLFSDIFPRIPALLSRLEKRAHELSEAPTGVVQPNRRDAEIKHFVRGLSRYFTKAYKQPFHAHVATITNSIFGINHLDEDKVRALVGIEKKHVPLDARKKKQRAR